MVTEVADAKRITDRDIFKVYDEEKHINEFYKELGKLKKEHKQRKQDIK